MKAAAGVGGFRLCDVVRLPSGRLGRVKGHWGGALCVAYLDAPNEELSILPQHVRPAAPVEGERK